MNILLAIKWDVEFWVVAKGRLYAQQLRRIHDYIVLVLSFDLLWIEI